MGRQGQDATAGPLSEGRAVDELLGVAVESSALQVRGRSHSGP